MSLLKKTENVLLFLTLLFLPTQLGRHFWPPFSFIYSLPIDYLSPTLYFWDLLVIALCSIFIAQGKHINWTAQSFFYFFILTQALSLLSGLANVGVGLVRLEQYFFAGLFGVYIASSDFTKIRKMIFWGIGLSIFLEAFLAASQFLKGGTLGFWILGERSFTLSTPGIAKFDFYGKQFLRPYATFPHPNTLGGFLVVAALILYSIKNLGKQQGSQVIIFLSGFIILLSVSRTALVAGFVSALLLAKKRGRILLVILVLALLPILYARFSSVFNFDSLTLTRRGEYIEAAFKLWEKSPILGVGLNNFIPADQNLLLSGPSRFLQPVHNIFLLTLSETGFLGLLGLLGLLGYPIWKQFQISNFKFLIIWGALIFLGMFDHYFLTLPQGYRLLFFLWGLSFASISHAKIT